MLANRIIALLETPITIVFLPVQLVTTFVLGLLAVVTFGLILVPLEVVWLVVFQLPLVGLSWLWDKAPLLRFPVAVIGIPLALLGSIYMALMPSMGDMEARVAGLRMCWTWPFTLDYLRYQRGQLDYEDERWTRLQRILGF